MKKRLITVEDKDGKTYVNLTEEFKFQGKLVMTYVPTKFEELRQFTQELIKNTKHQMDYTPEGFKLKIINKDKEYVGTIYFCKDRDVWMGYGFGIKRTIPQMWDIIWGFVNEKV